MENVLFEEIKKKISTEALEKIKAREAKWAEIEADVRAVVAHKIAQGKKILDIYIFTN